MGGICIREVDSEEEEEEEEEGTLMTSHETTQISKRDSRDLLTCPLE